MDGNRKPSLPSRCRKWDTQKILMAKVSAVDVYLTKYRKIICLQGRTQQRPEGAFCALRTVVPPAHVHQRPLSLHHRDTRPTEKETGYQMPIFSRS